MAERPPIEYAWTALAGAFVAGVGIALLPAAAPLAIGVGVGVVAAKFGFDAVLSRRGATSALTITRNSPEDQWANRATVAVRRFRALAGSAHSGPVAARCALIGAQAQGTLDAMQRLAGQASLVTRTLIGLNLYGLQAEDRRLSTAVATAHDPALTTDLQRSLRAIESQEAIAQRLQMAQQRLLAKLEASAIELEGLTARLAEVVALSETTDAVSGTARVDELSTEMEGLRQGLVEAESFSRQALGATSSADATASSTNPSGEPATRDDAGRATVSPTPPTRKP